MKRGTLLLLLPVSAFAQSSAAGDMSHQLLWFDDVLGQFVSTKSGFFLTVGWHEWVLFSGCATTMFLIRTALANRRHALFDLEGAVVLLGKILFAAVFLLTYNTLHLIPQYFTHGLAELVGTGMIDPLLQDVDKFVTGIQKPSLTDIVSIVVYFGTVVILECIALILFLLNSGSYLAIGMLATYGPLMIPFLVTQHFSRWFYRWVDMVAAYSMLPVSIVIFTFVWSGFFMKLFDTAIVQDISLDHFLTLLGSLLAMIGSFLLMALRLAAFNAELFSGAGGMGASMAASWENQLRGFVRSAGK